MKDFLKGFFMTYLFEDTAPIDKYLNPNDPVIICMMIFVRILILVGFFGFFFLLSTI